MEVKVRIKDGKKARFSKWAANRIGDSFSRFADSIRRVDAFISDLNGPRGGNDMNLLIVLRLWNGRQITVRTVGTGIGDTLDQSLDRTLFSFRKYLERHKSKRINRRSWEDGFGGMPQLS